jgi:NADH dehydrogenase
VIGGTGFVGRHVVTALENHEVPIVTISRHAGRRGGHRRADIADFEELSQALEGVRRVVNLVAASPLLPHGVQARYDHTHVRGVRALLAACRRRGVERLIHVGAMGVREDSTAGYARTKAWGERAVASSPVPSMVLSPSILFGWGSELIGTLDLGARLPVVPLPVIPTLFSPIFVGDFAKLIAEVAISSDAEFSARPSRLQVAGPDDLSGTTFAGRFFAARGCRTVPIPALAVEVAIRVAEAAKLPGFPADLHAMLSLENAPTGDAPLLRTSTSYLDWLGSVTRRWDLAPREPRIVFR